MLVRMDRGLACLWPALLALACGPHTATTEGGSGGGSGSDSAAGNATTGVDTVTEANSSGLVSDGTGGGGSGTGGGNDAEASCAALCGAYDTCAPELAGPDCLTDCVGGIAPPLPAVCAAAWVELYTCLAALDCDALLGDAPCPTEDAAVAASCPGSGTCSVEIDSATAKRCSYQEVCPGEPTRGLDCSNATCTCIVDGVEGASCPSDGICTNTGELGSKMLACCG